VKVVKNKVSPPFKTVEFDILYGQGISKEGELIDMGIKSGIVEKSGSWFSYKDQRIGQGKENVRQFMKENPKIAGEIETAIRAKSAVIAEALQGSPAEYAEEGSAADAA
jgi:recombination protein RecA